MGKVTKKAVEKHKAWLSPALVEFIQKATALPLVELPSHLATLPSRWPFPRGDLYNWIEVLDRFDDVLKAFNEKYGLNDGPQKQAFGSSILLKEAGESGPEYLAQQGFGPEADRELVEALLAFSRLLLEKCGNRALYNSTDRLNHLLNTTSLSLLHGALCVSFFLAQRYAERPSPPQQPHTPFYNFDHEKLHKLASPFVPPSLISNKRVPTTPVKGARSRDKTSPVKVRRPSVTLDPNDFRTLLKSPPSHAKGGKSSAELEHSEWTVWAQVRVTWTPAHVHGRNAPVGSAHLEDQAVPSSPTPGPRPPSGLGRSSTSASAGHESGFASSMPSQDSSGLQTIDLFYSDLAKTTVEEVLDHSPEEMPLPVQYELLHKLRIAYGLIHDPESRSLLLQIRLLSIAILGKIYDEHDFSHKLLGADANPSARQHLVQQVVSLLQESKKHQESVPLYIQTLAMGCLVALARQRGFAMEILTALSPNSNHGLQRLLIQKGLADLETDNDETDNAQGDDWREAVFSLLSNLTMNGMHTARTSDAVIHSSLVQAYASGLRIVTGKALRVHLRILEFMKSFFRHFKDGLQVLSANQAFEAACEQLDVLSRSALELLKDGQGIPAQFKTQVTDYQIPYMHQHVIRSTIDLINEVINYQGGHAERVLRNLVDSQSLLDAFRRILSNIDGFGAHTWSEAVKAIVSFLHNEPTSYTVISEAGIVKTLLDMLPADPGRVLSGSGQTIDASPRPVRLKLPASQDAIINISQAFGAICLTSTGYEQFKTSGALETFFSIFESPAHLKEIRDANSLALLGSTFDELVRHHPQLKDGVLSIVIVMVARVRNLCLSLSQGSNLSSELRLQLSAAASPPDAAGVHVPLIPAREDSEITRTILLPNTDLLDARPDSTSDGFLNPPNFLVADYARAAICFLMNFFENQALCTSFMETGAADLVLDFITLPTASAEGQSFGQNNTLPNDLASLVHMMAETKPQLILPVLTDRAQYICEQGLADFTQAQPPNGGCYFESFLKSSNGESARAEKDVELARRGVTTVRCLNAILLMSQVLADIFNLPIYSTRSTQNALFQAVNIADLLADLCCKLGALSAACYREEIALQKAIPDSWLASTRPGNYSTGDFEVDKILSVSDGTNQIISTTNGETHQSAPAGANNTHLQDDKETDSYKNAQILRYLLIETPSSVTEFFQRLGRGIMTKRRSDTFTKQKAFRVAEALAQAYIAQLRPHFLSTEIPVEDEEKQSRFSYLVVALSNVRGSLYDDSPSLGPGSSRQAFVIDVFRKLGGLEILTRIGTGFFHELKLCKVAQSMFSANTGLKVCLDILEDLTNARNIIDSLQAAHFKNSEPNRPFYFNPAHLLLELRMEALPLTQLIWDSEYVDQASNEIVQKLVAILKHGFTGDHESDAMLSTDRYPNLSPHSKRKFIIDTNKLSALKDRGFSEDLAREALFRCNVGPAASSTLAAEEYCKAYESNPTRRRLPIPVEEADESSAVPSLVRSTPAVPQLTGAASLFTDPLADIVNTITGGDNGSDDDEADDNQEDQATAPTGETSSAMHLDNILNAQDESTPNVPPSEQASVQLAKSRFSVQTIDAERETLRENLVERCNNILSNHDNLVFELSELIQSATKKLPEDLIQSFWDNTFDLLTNSLLSMQTDEPMDETQGKKIAAAAHLTALLMQDAKVFKSVKKNFQDCFDSLLSFLPLPPTISPTPDESSSPWVAPILLIVERMLCLDTEPPLVQWSAPSDMETCKEPELTYNAVLAFDQKKQLFELLIQVLPRVRKNKQMALSIIRLLVILTRERKFAVLLSQKGNLQKLFLMVKQLGAGSAGKLQASFMLVLRHIVEDEDTIKRIMASEIVAFFSNRSSSRQPDLTSFVRDNHHVVLRAPELFVEVANEKVKFSSWPHSASGSLTLRDSKSAASNDEPKEIARPDANQESNPAGVVAPSVEITAEGEKAKAADIKPPVVENPDGVIHFLLSELLAYKDVDDKEVSLADRKVDITEEHRGPNQNQSLPDSGVPNTSQHAERDRSPSAGDRHDRPKFRADEHPIFLYRCFLLHCLAELLYSYNQTKVELINFSRKADPLVSTPSKPRSGVLNYILNALVSSGYVDKDESIMCKKKMTTSEWAIGVIVALCTKTGENGLSGSTPRYSSHPQVDDQDTEPDLTFVRRFTLEHAIRAFKEATASTEPLQVRYSRILCLSDLFYKLLTKPSGPDGWAGNHNNSYKILGRMMFEKNLVSVLTSSLSEIDLSFPSAKKVIKFVLRPLHDLTSIAVHLSLTSPEIINSAMDYDNEDVLSSASSVSEMHDDREETPDLYRNSALGMLDPNRPDNSDTSEGVDEDEEMYDDDGYDDEMEYEGGVDAPNDGEVVSDDELESTVERAIDHLPADGSMDIEFVHEADTESDDEDDNESEDDDDDSENDDFEIEMNDDDAGEVNADDENESLGAGHSHEEEWEDEEDEDEDDEGDDAEDEDLHGGEDVAFDGEDLPIPVDIRTDRGGPHAELNNLLRVLGEQDLDVNGQTTPMRPQVLVTSDHQSDNDHDDDVTDEDDDADDIDDNEGMDYDEEFNLMLDGPDDLDGADQWRWDETPAFFRRHRHTGGRNMPSFMSRRIHAMESDILHPGIGGGRHHRHAPQARPGADDGINPLLQRPETGIHRAPGIHSPINVISMDTGLAGLPRMNPGMMRAGNHGMISMQIPLGGDLPMDSFGGSHGAVLDALVHVLNQQGGNNRLFSANGPGGFGPFQLNISAPPFDLRDMLGRNIPLPHSRQPREEPSRVASFVAMSTTSRWQEEARMLFGSTDVEKIMRVQLLLSSRLVPFAQEEEKARRQKRKEEEERQKKEREEAAKRDEERRQKVKEEEAATEKAEEEAKARAGAQVATSAEQPADQPDEDLVDAPEPVDGVQNEESHGAQDATTTGETSQQRVITRIRGRELDITGLDIDLEYLDALPEELREEVIMSQYTERREQQQQQGTEETTTIDPDFLDALPEDIREEIRQQEALMARRRDRENRRRQETAAGTAQAEEMDNDNFLATLDPILRRDILAEQPPEVLSQLDPRHAAEGRAQQRNLFFQHRVGENAQRNDSARQEVAERQKRQVVQLVDKAGVATLLRLMFLPHQGSLKQNLYQILSNVCGNRQTRFEVISLLLIILKEGSTDVTAVERSLANLSLRAKASGVQKTPLPLKRTLSMPPLVGISEEITPLVVVNQCLSALTALCRLGFHVRTIFLREVDVNSAKHGKKLKGKEGKTTKYPLNDLIALLDRRLIMDSSSSLEALAQLLSLVTGPLAVLMKKEDKLSPANENDARQVEVPGEPESTAPPDDGTARPESSGQDTAMTEAPTAERTLTSAETHNGEGDDEDHHSKKKVAFEPPTVSEHNLRLITSVFVAPECHVETFTAILDTLRHLSHVPGNSVIFSRELIRNVQHLSTAIGTDLDELLPLILEAQSTSDLQGVTFSKFSASSSDQVKLLRVLQALDWLSAPKKDSGGEPDTKKSILNSAYDTLSLGPLWHKLSACLTAVREKGDTIGFTNILLPLIESLMVVCKNTPLKDAPVQAQTQETSTILQPRPEGMSDLEELFFNFTTEHRKILNDIVRQSPKLMQGNGNFALLVKNSKVLDFDNKRAYFAKLIHTKQHHQRHMQPPLQLSVRRDHVFLDSYKNLYFKSADEMKYGKLNIRFNGEEGVDAGGVTREWFQVLARGMFDPNYALFQPVASDRTTFHPSSVSAVNPEHLAFFKFIGRIIGKALHEGRVLDCHFSRAVYKRILSKSPNLKDLESQDVDYYKSLVWILENDITDVLSGEFCVVEDDFGAEKIIDLIPDGRNVTVTEENKKEYVQKLVEYRLTESVKEQLDAFLQGFHDIIPADLVAIFNEQELELLISGLPEIDVDDWKANTEYHNYSPSSSQIVWFWRIVRGMTNEERAKLLQFITGTSKVPLNGFKELEGVSGLTRFNIHKDPSTNRLPTSHTCFNQLDLPAYDSFEVMKHNLSNAINLGADYFGFA